MKITAQDLDQLGVIDVIITEPVGGAHRDRESIMKATGDAIARALAEFDGKTPAEIRRQRHDRGSWKSAQSSSRRDLRAAALRPSAATAQFRVQSRGVVPESSTVRRKCSVTAKNSVTLTKC